MAMGKWEIFKFKVIFSMKLNVYKLNFKFYNTPKKFPTTFIRTLKSNKNLLW